MDGGSIPPSSTTHKASRMIAVRIHPIADHASNRLYYDLCMAGFFERLRRKGDSAQPGVANPHDRGNVRAPDRTVRSGVSPSRAAPADPFLVHANIPRGGVVMAVGESHYQDNFLRVAGNKRHAGFDDDCIAHLVPEPSNPYDPNAVMVTLSGLTVGYLNRGDALQYHQLVTDSISRSGIAAVVARVKGGWDRGGGDVGSFGIDLYFSDRPDAAAPPAPDEFRLRGSATVSVSGEEHFQETLSSITKGSRLVYSYPAVAQLIPSPGNPHLKDAAGILEVHVDGNVVGFLTPAMSARFDRVSALASSLGKRLTCSASIFQGSKAGAEIIEIRLSACPHGADEEFVVDEYFQIISNLVQGRRARKVHKITQTLDGGAFRTVCGEIIAGDGATVLASTKPSVGEVDPATRRIITVDYCDLCL